MKTTKTLSEFNKIANKHEFFQNWILNKKEWKTFLKNAPEISLVDEDFQTQQRTCHFCLNTHALFLYSDSSDDRDGTKEEKESEAWYWLEAVKEDLERILR